MFNVGDKVYFTDPEDGNIPAGSIGIIQSPESYDCFNVKFDNIRHRNPYVDSETWLCCGTNLELVPKDPQKPSDDLTLTIPLVEGADYLRGRFTDSRGDVYSVHVEKIQCLAQKEV